MRIGFFLFWALLFVHGGAFAQSLCVSRSGAVLRASPDSRAPASWKVPRHMPLLSTGQSKGGWYEVMDVDGQKHWASKKDVSFRTNCIVVRVRKVRLRKGPGNNFDHADAGVADRYSAFRDLGGEDGWTQVEDELGQRAWVNLDHTWKANGRLRMSFGNGE